MLPYFSALHSFQTDYDPLGISALGSSVTATVHVLTFEYHSKRDQSHQELLRVIRLPNRASLRQLDFPSYDPSAFAGEAGLELPNECEERSIAFICRSEYLRMIGMRIKMPFSSFALPQDKRDSDGSADVRRRHGSQARLRDFPPIPMPEVSSSTRDMMDDGTKLRVIV